MVRPPFNNVHSHCSTMTRCLRASGLTMWVTVKSIRFARIRQMGRFRSKKVASAIGFVWEDILVCNVVRPVWQSIRQVWSVNWPPQYLDGKCHFEEKFGIIFHLIKIIISIRINLISLIHSEPPPTTANPLEEEEEDNNSHPQNQPNESSNSRPQSSSGSSSSSNSANRSQAGPLSPQFRPPQGARLVG